MTCRSLPAAYRVPQPWRNGGGVTYEIAREPHTQRAGDFLWRVSLAEVATPGAFSAFIGHERLIAVVSGQGMLLRRQPGNEEIVLRPWQVHRFDGSDPVEGELPFGAVRDFNVIFDPALVQAALSFHVGPDPLALAPGPEPLALAPRVAIACNVDAVPVPWSGVGTNGALSPFDALYVTAEAVRLDLKPDARVALVTLDRLAR